MTRAEKYLIKLRSLFLKNNVRVSEIEATTGNYDEKAKLIEKPVLTITTEFSEIGVYNNIMYFTFVFNSNSYKKDFFDLIKSYLNVKTYGFKDFKTIFYPSKNFNLNKFEKNIKKEKYFQAQFTYNISSKTPEFLYKEYLIIRDKVISSGVKIINQLEVNLIQEALK